MRQAANRNWQTIHTRRESQRCEAKEQRRTISRPKSESYSKKLKDESWNRSESKGKEKYLHMSKWMANMACNSGSRHAMVDCINRTALPLTRAVMFRMPSRHRWAVRKHPPIATDTQTLPQPTLALFQHASVFVCH